MPNEIDLRGLFDSLSYETLQQAVTEGWPETLRLDFKQFADPAFGKQDRDNLGRAISGFANAVGGIVVWGVKAREVQGVNQAIAPLIPTPTLERARTALVSAISQASNPIVRGVDARAIAHPDGDGKGFLAVYIPESHGDPVMALFDNRYWRRSGDSFRKMEHHEIADMFGKRHRAVLTLEVRIVRAGVTTGPMPTTHDGKVILGIRNSGRGVARFPAITLLADQPYQLSQWGLDGNRHTGLSKRVNSGVGRVPIVFAGGANDVVHVDEVLDVTLIDVSIREPSLTASDLTVHYRISAAEVAPVEGVHRIPGAVLSQSIGPHGLSVGSGASTE